MVVMNRADEGHPVGAMLLLCSMFAFAWVFHAVTTPDARLPAQFNAQIAALALSVVPIVPEVPAVPDVLEVPAVPVPTVRLASGTTGTTETSETSETPITLRTSGTPGTLGTLGTIGTTVPPAAFPASVNAVAPGEQSRESGAVSRAFGTTGAALRSAFR